MQKFSLYWLLSILLLQTALVVPAQETVLKRGTVSSDALIIRAKPASYYERLGQLKRGDAVQVVGKKEDWYEILLPESVRGWVRAEHLNAENKVISDTCFISAGAGDFFTPFFRVPPGTVVKTIGFPSNGWVQVQPPTIASAWVSSAYVVLDDEQKRSAPSTQAGEVTVAAPELAALEKQRNLLKQEHARQQENLKAEQERLEQLRLEAEKLQKATQADTAVVTDLQREAERLQALKEAAEAKAALARVEREKALLLAAEEQKQLEIQKQAAEQKAQTVMTEKEKWELEAQKTAAAIARVRQETQRQADLARAEAEQLEKERTDAVLKAEEALKKAFEAEEKKKETEAKQAVTLEAIAALQKGLADSEAQVNQLRLERERMELATRAETAKLEAARLEAEKLTLEKREMALRIEQSKKEREEITRQAEEDAKRLAALKEEAEKQARSVSELQKQKEAREAAAAEVAAAANAESPPDESGKKRLLLTIPVPPQTQAASASVSVQVESAETAAVTAAGEKPAVEEKQPAAAADESQAQATLPEEIVEEQQAVVRWTGVLQSLRNQASRNASHVLCERKNYALHPLCYVKSTLLDLRQWENQEVEISGKEVQIPGWSRPVILVNSIIKK